MSESRITYSPFPPPSVGIRGSSVGTRGTTGAGALVFCFIGSVVPFGSFGLSTAGIGIGAGVAGIASGAGVTVGAIVGFVSGLASTTPVVAVQPVHGAAELTTAVAADERQPHAEFKRARMRANKPTRALGAESQQAVEATGKADRSGVPQWAGAAKAVCDETKLDRSGVPHGLAGAQGATAPSPQSEVAQPPTDRPANRLRRRSSRPNRSPEPHAAAPHEAEANVAVASGAAPQLLQPEPTETTGAGVPAANTELRSNSEAFMRGLLPVREVANAVSKSERPKPRAMATIFFQTIHRSDRLDPPRPQSGKTLEFAGRTACCTE